MLGGEIGEPVFLFWIFGLVIFVVIGTMKNSSDGQQRAQGGGVVSRSARSSFRAISSYLRIVSAGASTVARSAVSVASSIVDREDDSSHDQVREGVFCFLFLSNEKMKSIFGIPALICCVCRYYREF